jgi:hypothetical protein
MGVFNVGLNNTGQIIKPAQEHKYNTKTIHIYKNKKKKTQNKEHIQQEQNKNVKYRDKSPIPRKR